MGLMDAVPGNGSRDAEKGMAPMDREKIPGLQDERA